MLYFLMGVDGDGYPCAIGCSADIEKVRSEYNDIQENYISQGFPWDTRYWYIREYIKEEFEDFIDFTEMD